MKKSKNNKSNKITKYNLQIDTEGSQDDLVLQIVQSIFNLLNDRGIKASIAGFKDDKYPIMINDGANKEEAK